MARQTINTGTANNSGDGEGLRSAFGKCNDNFAELYTATGWESRFQATAQTLTASDNLITITGTSESNGGLTFLDTNGKVEPIQVNDVLAIDFGCTAVTPTGSDNYLHLKFVVNSVVYRAVTIPLLKGSGNDEHVSLSANMPVGSDFNTHGMDIYIETNVGFDISNKYISVTRTHKAS
jgi:hypothetical protein